VINVLRALPVINVTDHRRLLLWVAFGLSLLGLLALAFMVTTLPFLRKLALSAAQAGLFNHYLARRLGDGLFRRVLAGDVMAALAQATETIRLGTLVLLAPPLPVLERLGPCSPVVHSTAGSKPCPPIR
jgi:hypothetical protein